MRGHEDEDENSTPTHNRRKEVKRAGIVPHIRRWVEGKQTIEPIDGFEGLLKRHEKHPLSPGCVIWMARSFPYVLCHDMPHKSPIVSKMMLHLPDGKFISSYIFLEHNLLC